MASYQPPHLITLQSPSLIHFDTPDPSESALVDDFIRRSVRASAPSPPPSQSTPQAPIINTTINPAMATTGISNQISGTTAFFLPGITSIDSNTQPQTTTATILANQNTTQNGRRGLRRRTRAQIRASRQRKAARERTVTAAAAQAVLSAPIKSKSTPQASTKPTAGANHASSAVIVAQMGSGSASNAVAAKGGGDEHPLNLLIEYLDAELQKLADAKKLGK